MTDKHHEYEGDGIGKWLLVYVRCTCGFKTKDRLFLYKAKKEFARHIQGVRRV